MTRALRCAIYTRKSTEEGLEQAFNSLDAQREACAAYIKSQVGEGWRLVDRHYDDGGFSGGTMDRPALQRLLADVEKSQIDVVVVYKIDRLTRSLVDFAKIVERFEKRNVSFVSVTQAFNTTTSMGRLTLNVLLSFAQFEREVTAERIRDKIAASRAKGIFMGGCPPIGYDARDRELVINEAEAKAVRMIFSRYTALGSIGKLCEELNESGIKTKAFVSTRGRAIGGGDWHVGPLRHVLRNRVYIGEAVHKGKSYAGEHRPIVARELFDKVQRLLTGSAKGWRRKRTIESSALLTGLIFDDKGNRMSPQWSIGNGGKKHCYYVSQAVLQRRKCQVGSLPRVRASVADDLTTACLAAFDQTPKDAAFLKRQIHDFVSRVVVAEGALRVLMRPHIVGKQISESKRIATVLGRMPLGSEIARDDEGYQITIHARLRRNRGVALTPSAEPGDWSARERRVNRALLAALAKAHAWRQLIELGQVGSVEQLSVSEKTDRKDLRQILRLAFLAPDIQKAIAEGRQPSWITVANATRHDLPHTWIAQREILRFNRS